jgi:hypothetical protein
VLLATPKSRFKHTKGSEIKDYLGDNEFYVKVNEKSFDKK